LRRFWTASDRRAQDWHIHRAREYYQRHFVLSKTGNARQIARNARTTEQALDAAANLNRDVELLLDEPPQPNPFEDALFELQERALWRSKRPLYCQNGVNCERRNSTRNYPTGPYFLSAKVGMKYCSDDCSQEGRRASNRKSWAINQHKWRPK